MVQENFFDLVKKPDIVFDSTPSRTRSTFWNSDLMAMAVKLRELYISVYSVEESEVLKSAYKWLKGNEGNKLLLANGYLPDKSLTRKLPEEVLLNWETLTFFTMQEDFKRPLLADTFEPFVAFKPGTEDWIKDVRLTTIDYITKLKTLPLELDKSHKLSSRLDLDSVRKRLTVSEDVARRSETVDAITWVSLNKYHLELMRREKIILKNLFPQSIKG